MINSRLASSSAPAGYRFPREVIAVAVRWYLRYGLSYRDVEELLAERGIEVDHVRIYPWVQTFPLSGAAPLAVFRAVEADALKPLPRSRFVLATWSRGTVGPDIHVKVGRCLYSVPWRFIGQKVDARATFTTVQIFATGELIATHAAKSAGKQADMSHYPPKKIAFAMRTPTWCRTQAEQVGPHTVTVIAELLQVNALFRLRAAQGVLRLADKYGTDRLEAACGKAIYVGDPSYRTVKGILVAGLEADPPPPATGDGGAAAFLHGPERLLGNVVALPMTEAST